MCGRFTHLYTWQELHRLMRLTTPPVDIPRRYNVAPTQNAPVVRADGPARSLAMLRWGLVPLWADDAGVGAARINARAETVASKPSFRGAFKRRRCLVPISGFYEWRATEPHVEGLFGVDPVEAVKRRAAPRKQPFLITLSDGSPMLLAGLWERWRDPSAGEGSPPLETFTILTTTPNELMAKLHDRMPVIVDSASVDRWLDPASPITALAKLFEPYPAELMVASAVSTRVNNPRHDDPGCLRKA